MFWRIFMLILTVLIISGEVDAYPRGHGRSFCRCESKDMNAKDAIIWTIFNPTECGMSFITYVNKVSDYVREMKKVDTKDKLLSASLWKHVQIILKEFKKGEVDSYGAFFHEEYYNNLVYYRTIGIDCGLDEFALREMLQGK